MPLGAHIFLRMQTFANAEDVDYTNSYNVQLVSGQLAKTVMTQDQFDRIQGLETWQAVQALAPNKDVCLFPNLVGIEPPLNLPNKQ